MLNSDLIYLISTFCNLDDYINIASIDKESFIYLNRNIPLHIQKEWCKLQLKNYPKEILDNFDLIKLYNVPIFNIGRKIEPYEYIDFIKPSFFIRTNILRGKDIYNRQFISFLYNNNNVSTLFQRYIDDNYYVIGGDYLPGLNNSLYNNNIFEILSKLFNNNKVKYSYFDTFTNLKVIVQLYLQV